MNRQQILFAGAVFVSLVLWSSSPTLVRAAEGVATDDAVILEESLDIDIKSPSEATERYLRRTEVLTRKGIEQFDSVAVDYNSYVTIRELRGAIVSPDGKRVELKKQQISDRSYTTFQMYDETKLKVIDYPDVLPGSTLEYQYEKSLRTLFFMDDFFPLQESVPVRLKTLTVRVPASLPIRLSVHGASPEYNREEKDGLVIHRWQVRDLPALPDEESRPPGQDALPAVWIEPKDIVLGDYHIDASSWNGIARWEWNVARDRMVPSIEVDQMARELTAGLSEPEAKTRHLFEFVQQKVNYVAIYLGIGGWQPHSSGDVLKHRYGDCKDKATLLIAMLRSIGLKGLPVLILTRDHGVIDRDNPSISFNHMIVALPRESGYLFIDPTVTDTPYGDLPWEDQGVPVLLVKDDGQGELLETPLFPADRNRWMTSVNAQLKPTGELEGTYQIEAWGQRRTLLTELQAAKPSQREEALAYLTAWLCPGAVLQGQDVKVPPEADQPARATIRFTVPRFMIRAAGRELVSPHLVRFQSLARATAYPQRRLPIVFKNLFSDTAEIRLHLPPGRTLKKVPADRIFNGPGVQATSHYQLVKEQDHQVLIIKRSFAVERREIPVSDYAGLRTFVSSLADEETSAVTLEFEATA